MDSEKEGIFRIFIIFEKLMKSSVEFLFKTLLFLREQEIGNYVLSVGTNNFADLSYLFIYLSL